MPSPEDEEASLSDSDSSDDNKTSTQSAGVAVQRLSRVARDDAKNKLSMLMDSDEEEEEKLKPKPSVTKKRKVNASLLSTSMSEDIPSFSPIKNDVIAKKKSKTNTSQAISNKSTPDPPKQPAEVKRLVSRLGDIEWMEAELGEERLASVSKAIDKIFEMSLSADNFRLFGNDMIQCFYDVGTGIQFCNIKY